ncbi:MAG: hypothetical protein AABZ76_07290 [Pseudomonadota bacterium]
MTTTILLYVLSFLVAVLCWCLFVTTRAFVRIGTATPDQFAKMQNELIAKNPARFERVRDLLHGEGR